MAWIAAAIGGSALVGAGASIFGSMTQANAAQSASQAQTQLGQQALAQQLGLFNTAKGELDPFINAGSSVLPTLTKLLTPGSDMSQVLSQIPGFQFAQQYGQKAITNQATSRGLSGNALTAGADYATGSANSAYSGIVQALLSQAGIGSGAAGSLASAAGATGGQVGSTLGGIGNSIASGILGSANAQASGATGVANAVSGGANGFMNYNLLQSLLNKNSGGAVGIYSGGGNNGASPVWT
jgi:hypothetical protein